MIAATVRLEAEDHQDSDAEPDPYEPHPDQPALF